MQSSNPSNPRAGDADRHARTTTMRGDIPLPKPHAKMKRFLEHNNAQRTKAWTQRRNQIITASIVADCLGFGDMDCIDYLQVLQARSHLDGFTNFPNNAMMTHGIQMEEMIHVLYQVLTGRRTRTCNLMEPLPEDRHYGKIGASLDAIVTSPDGQDQSILCEFKAPFYQMYSPSGTKNVHGIPMRHVFQMMMQMYVSKCTEAHYFAVCQRTMQYQLASVTYDRDWWEAWVLPRISEVHGWWKGYGTPPPMGFRNFPAVPQALRDKIAVTMTYVKVRHACDAQGIPIPRYGSIKELWSGVQNVLKELDDEEW